MKKAFDLSLLLLAALVMLAFSACSENGASASVSATTANTPSPPIPKPVPTAVITTTPAPSLPPLTGFKIGLDPGHQSVPDREKEPNSPNTRAVKDKVSSGTRGRWTGVYEYEVNLQVALKLKSKLEALGAQVIMTRETNEVQISNIERAQMMNEAGVDCWLRLHANQGGSAEESGMFMLVPEQGCMDTSDPAVYEKSYSLAEALLKSVTAQTGASDTGLHPRSDQTGFNWSQVPVCNLEMGYMSNETEDRLLVLDEYQQKIAKGLAQGFLDYFAK